jgi:hypothetical protein
MHKKPSMRTSLLLILAAIALVSAGTAAHAANNPEPCYESWTCLYPPVITASPSGPSSVCSKTTGAWYVNGSISNGTKKRCSEEQPVIPNGIVWGWTLSGPESSSGASNSFEYTPVKCGAYTISWVGYASGAEPCTVETYTTTQTFNVPCDSGSATMSSAHICPGKSDQLTWTITNTGECTATFGWLAYALDGDPTVSVAPQTGGVTLAPGETGTGTITATVTADSARGDKTIRFEVDTPTTLGAANATGTVTVPIDMGTATVSSAEICRGKSDQLTWTITNTGECTATYGWLAYALDGDPTVTVAPQTGGVTLAPGQTGTGTFTASVSAASARGDKTIRFEVDTPSRLGVANATGTVTVPKPEGKAIMGTTQGCRDFFADVPWTIKNTGKCRETFTWTAVATVGAPIITVNVATGTVTLDAGASESGLVPLSIAANSPRGIKTIHFTLTDEDGVVVDQGDGSVEVSPAQAVATFDDATACPGTTVALPFTVTNTGKCRESFTVRVTQIAGTPPAILPPAITVNLVPRAIHRGTMNIRLRRPDQGPLTFRLLVLADGAQVTSDDAKVTLTPVTVDLKAENNLTECMEGRVITFTATANGPCWTGRKDFTFHFQRADGSRWTATEWTFGTSVDHDAVADQVPDGNANHFFNTPIFVRCEDAIGNMARSSTLMIRVYELWIKNFADAATGKKWKVCIGDSIAYDAIASSDCTNFNWDMEDGVPDAWNPTGGNAKTGSGMVIPNSDKARASNSWFGDAYGTVTVSCEDGEGNSHVFYSTSMNPGRKASVFFDPDTNVDGGAPSTAKPPAWFVFYKQADIVDGMAATSYDQNNDFGAANGTSVTLGPLAVTTNSGPETLHDMSGTAFTMTGSGKHLKCLAETLAHENYHNYIRKNFAGGTQSDTDRINDAEELSPHRSYFPRSDPANADTFGYHYPANAHGDYSDNEVRCRIVELHGLPAIRYARDWAKDVENPKW